MGHTFFTLSSLLSVTNNSIVALESSHNPCVPTPCGPHSLCRNVSNVAECTCLKGIKGIPPDCGTSCLISAECSKHEDCIQGKCINPCMDGCGVQAECIVFNRRPVCVCPHGYTGDPYSTCVPDMSHHHNTTQSYPCEPSPCGPNSACESVNGQVVCECLPQYIGSPPACHPKCTSDSDCQDHLSCIKNSCADPCSGLCGSNSECRVVRRSSTSGCPPDSIGHDAECRVVEHTPVCICKAGYTGDPFIRCDSLLNPIVAVESSLDPCVPTPCGLHSLCRNVNSVAECRCLKGVNGTPPNCGSSCVVSAECSKHEACTHGKCVNPCRGGCGVQAECIVFNHRPACVCPHGYAGDPYNTCMPDLSHHHNTTQTHPCEPSPCGPNSACESVNGQVVCECLPQYAGSPPDCHLECTSDSDCRDHLSCIKNSCADPCADLCGSNAECRVITRSSKSGCPPDSIGHDAECQVVEQHTPVCTCKAGYIGDPFVRCDALLNPIAALQSNFDPCVPTPCGPHSLCRNVNSVPECRCLKGFIGIPPNCGSSCVISTECPKHEACIHGKCVNPCRGVCGVQAECIVFNHHPVCVCPHGYAGDPFNICIPDLSHHHNTTQTYSCEPSPCGPNSACESVNGQVVCECLPQYIGSPPDCHQECTSDSDCRDHLSCIKNRCADPCSDICGSNAECHVVTRSSKSGCPPDSIGHDAECLVVEQHTPVCTCKAGYTGNPFLLCAALLHTMRFESAGLPVSLHKRRRPTTSNQLSAHAVGSGGSFGSIQAFSAVDKSVQSYEVESEEEAVEYDSTPAVFISSAPAEVTTTTAAAPPTPSPLTRYRLEEFPWAQDLIDTPSDTLRLRLDNGTEISLRLAKDEKDEPADAGEACAPSAAGGAGGGFCTYLRRCAAARAFTVQDYQTLYCDRDGYAGVCCPTGDDDQSTTEVASH